MSETNNLLYIRKDKNKLALFMHLGRLGHGDYSKGTYLLPTKKIKFFATKEDYAQWEEDVGKKGHECSGMYYCLTDMSDSWTARMGFILARISSIALAIECDGPDYSKLVTAQEELFSLFIPEHRANLYKFLMEELLNRYCLENGIPKRLIYDPNSRVGSIFAKKPASVLQGETLISSPEYKLEESFDFSML